jgi:hypothetical protein
MDNGGLKVYRNPASKEGQTLGRLFQNRFLCKVVSDESEVIVTVFAAGGIIFGLEFK